MTEFQVSDEGFDEGMAVGRAGSSMNSTFGVFGSSSAYLHVFPALEHWSQVGRDRLHLT